MCLDMASACQHSLAQNSTDQPIQAIQNESNNKKMLHITATVAEKCTRDKQYTRNEWNMEFVTKSLFMIMVEMGWVCGRKRERQKQYRDRGGRAVNEGIIEKRHVRNRSTVTNWKNRRRQFSVKRKKA